jgi:hypothetical protein
VSVYILSPHYTKQKRYGHCISHWLVILPLILFPAVLLDTFKLVPACSRLR